jgi:hypothetical protein
MNRYLRLCLAVTLFVSLFGGIAMAQAPPAASAQPQGATIKLQIVLSRYDGDKKLSSFPYTLSLVSGVNGSLRAGSEVPVPTTSVTTEKGATTAYTLQQVGSQIDASVNPTTDGKYKLALTVTERSVVPPTPGSALTMPNVPTFRNMVSASQAILGNGETIQFTASSDRATSETFKIDVTLSVGNK